MSKILANSISNLLRTYGISKAVGKENVSDRFLKDVSDVRLLAPPITQINNLFIKLSHFPKDCKLAKLKPFLYKISLFDP